MREGGVDVPLAVGVWVSSRSPLVLGPPLHGARYLDINGCCGESAHTRALLPIDGQRYLPQRDAIDWLRLDSHGRSRVGDPSKNESYVIFGDPVIAAGSGVVIDTRNDLPENIPPHPLANLNVQNVLGNHVTEALGGGRYAAYTHLQPGSVVVHVGQRVHRGELLGRVGNTGSSTAPHLHFQRSPMGRTRSSPTGNRMCSRALHSPAKRWGSTKLASSSILDLRRRRWSAAISSYSTETRSPSL